MNSLLSLSEVAHLIRDGIPLSLAGEESCLDQLPKGPWVGGTIPYFMSEEGGLKNKELVFVTRMPGNATVTFNYLPSDGLDALVAGTPDNGYALAIVPAFSAAHASFAENCRDYEDAYVKPTIGWVAGMDLDNAGKQLPKVYDGTTGRKYADGVVVAYVALPEGQLASIEIVNMFEPDGLDVVRFPDGGFSATECLVNGRPTQLAPYLVARGNGDGKLPLVGDFAGAHANVSFQTIDQQSGHVMFYAPVFPDVEYWIAKPVADYAGTLDSKLRETNDGNIAFSCNCILNYVYGELEGKKVGKLAGPITFGEIGYQLLNQTFVALRIE